VRRSLLAKEWIGEVEGHDSRSVRSSSAPSRFLRTLAACWRRRPWHSARLCGLLLATGSSPPSPRLRQSASARRQVPLQRGGMISVKPQESPAIFSTVEKPTNLFSNEPFRKLRAKKFPLGWKKTHSFLIIRAMYDYHITVFETLCVLRER